MEGLGVTGLTQVTGGAGDVCGTGPGAERFTATLKHKSRYNVSESKLTAFVQKRRYPWIEKMTHRIGENT